MYGSIHLKREDRRRDIDLWPPAASSLIHHAVCVHAAITPPAGSFSSSASHSSTCLGNKLCAPLRPPAAPSSPFSSTAPLSHSYTQRRSMTGLLTTRGSETWQRQICADEYLLSQHIKQPFDSKFMNRILYLSSNVFDLMLLFDTH